MITSPQPIAASKAKKQRRPPPEPVLLEPVIRFRMRHWSCEVNEINEVPCKRFPSLPSLQGATTSSPTIVVIPPDPSQIHGMGGWGRR